MFAASVCSSADRNPSAVCPLHSRETTTQQYQLHRRERSATNQDGPPNSTKRTISSRETRTDKVFSRYSSTTLKPHKYSMIEIYLGVGNM